MAGRAYHHIMQCLWCSLWCSVNFTVNFEARVISPLTTLLRATQPQTLPGRQIYLGTFPWQLFNNHFLQFCLMFFNVNCPYTFLSDLFCLNPNITNTLYWLHTHSAKAIDVFLHIADEIVTHLKNHFFHIKHLNAFRIPMKLYIKHFETKIFLAVLNLGGTGWFKNYVSSLANQQTFLLYGSDLPHHYMTLMRLNTL